MGTERFAGGVKGVLGEELSRDWRPPGRALAAGLSTGRANLEAAVAPVVVVACRLRNRNVQKQSGSNSCVKLVIKRLDK